MADSLLRRNVPPPPQPPPQEKEYTVSELSGEIRRRVEGKGESLRLRAELGRVTQASSGHVYVDLKDDKATINGVIWRDAARKLLKNLRLETGLEVVCRGRLKTYAPQSKYNLMIDSMAPAGEGALMAMLEARRRRLASEGWFDAERKQKLPKLPRVIGVVTSPGGAVIHDIRHRLQHRFPCHVLVWPVRVQGEQCAEEVVAGIEGFNALPAGGAIPRPQLLIVARGGGSIEDLWGFNEESVVRAAGNSSIPLISAIGHESDYTLIDHAADQRAPTPSAAAEMAVPVRLDLLANASDLARRLAHAARRRLQRDGERLADAARHVRRSADVVALKNRHFDMTARNLNIAFERWQARKKERFVVLQSAIAPYSPRRMLERARERINDLHGRNRRAIDILLFGLREQWQRHGDLLEACSHKRVLERGFALVWDTAGKKSGNLLGSAADLRAGMRVWLEFAGERRVAADVVGEETPRRNGDGNGNGEA